MTISKKSMKWIPWILILPVVIIRGFTTLYPIIVTLKNSLFDVKVLSGVNKFVGLANYVNVFKDPKVQTSISFTVEFVVVSMVFHVVLGVILALILNMKFKGRRFLRTIVLIPWAMPAVVIGMAAKWGFNNDYGLVNDFIRRFVPNFQYDWMIHTGSARAAVIAMDLWKDLPFFAILVLSGLQFISGDIYEAAKVDGANGVQIFFRITLPLILKNVITLCIPFTLWRLTAFDLVYAMTSGGPGEDTSLIAYRITDSNLNHTGIYLYSKGKIMIHLTFDYKTDEKCTTPGQYLKYHRTFQGLSTRELAEKVGIVPATLVLYENDRHPIKYSTAVALANVLGIDRNRLLDEYTAFVDYPYSSLLKMVRQELSLTQMQMAEVIGIGQTSYSGWEREIRVPRRKEYEKILAALKKLKVNVDTYLCHPAST